MATLTVVDAELIRAVLSPHEQKLLRLSEGKTAEQVYNRFPATYDGPNGVRDALDQIRAKLKQAAEARRSTDRSLEDVLADHLDDDDDTGGIPIRTVPRASMNGAGADNGHAPEGVPPTVSAPASSDRLPAVVDPPAPASHRAQRKLPASVRDQQVLDALAEGQQTARQIAESADCSVNVIHDAVKRLSSAGKIEFAGTTGGRGAAPIYALAASKAVDRPAPSPAKPTPPPASARTTEPRPVPTQDVEALVRRYVELLLSYLEGAAEGGEPSPEALMDRIERVLGLGSSGER